MTVISEQKLCGYLNRVLDLSHSVLARVEEAGADPVPTEILDQYTKLVNDLNAERANDPTLSEDPWNWIWEDKASYNHIQLYGRLAWINLQLLELL